MAGGGNKKRCQNCTESSGIVVYLRALQGHSGRNLIDPDVQNNIMLFRATSSSTFIMSDVQSITLHHQFGIDTWRSKFEQQTESMLPACGSYGQES